MVIFSKINKTSFIQYIFLYILISAGGMALPEYITNDRFIILLLLMSTYCIVFKHTLSRLQTNYLIFLGALFLSMFTVVAGSTLSLGTTLSVLSIPLLVYATYKIDPFHYIQRFIKLLYYIAIISIIIFAIIRIWGFSTFSFLFPLLHPSYSGIEHNIYSYGGFIYRFVFLHHDRNCGPFGEPGQYQCMLSVALYFSLFRPRLFKKKEIQKYIIVFFLALITTLSTSGYLAIGILIICFLCQSAKRIDRRTKRIFIIALICTLFFMQYTDVGNDFMHSAIYNKIYESGNSEKFNIAHNTGGARVASIDGVLNTIIDNPIILFGVGYDQLAFMKLEGCAGLLYLLLAIGIVPYSILFGFCFYQVYQHNKGISDMAVRILLVINMGLGQPHIMNPALFIMMLYPYFCANSFKWKKTLSIKKNDV